MNKAEKAYVSKVAELACACCGAIGEEIHHIREGQGMAQRSSNYLVIHLCVACHRGPQGVHGDKSMMRIFKTSELDMLADTIRWLHDAQ